MGGEEELSKYVCVCVRVRVSNNGDLGGRKDDTLAHTRCENCTYSALVTSLEAMKPPVSVKRFSNNLCAHVRVSGWKAIVGRVGTLASTHPSHFFARSGFSSSFLLIVSAEASTKSRISCFTATFFACVVPPRPTASPRCSRMAGIWLM